MATRRRTDPFLSSPRAGLTGRDQRRRSSTRDSTGGGACGGGESRRGSMEDDGERRSSISTQRTSRPTLGSTSSTLRTGTYTPGLLQSTLRGALREGVDIGTTPPLLRKSTLGVTFAPDPPTLPSTARRRTSSLGGENVSATVHEEPGAGYPADTGEGLSPLARPDLRIGGHQGLILHVLCPRLADAVYPWIMHPWMSATALLLYPPALLLSTLGVMGVLPLSSALVSLLALPSAFQRCLLVDFEILVVLGVHFEVYFVAINWLLSVLASIALVERELYMSVYILIVHSLVFPCLFMDALRLSEKRIMFGCVTGAACIATVCVVHIFELMPGCDYDM
jgi:hypothetical protein